MTSVENVGRQQQQQQPCKCSFSYFRDVTNSQCVNRGAGSLPGCSQWNNSVLDYIHASFACELLLVVAYPNETHTFAAAAFKSDKMHLSRSKLCLRRKR